MTGCPKVGTHAAMALLDRLGLRRYPGTILPGPSGLYVAGLSQVPLAALRQAPDNTFILGHVPADHDLPGFVVVLVLRHPQNVVCSYLRHRRREDRMRLTVAQALVDFWGMPFVECYRSYLGWQARAIVIRYENMPPAMIGDGRGIYRDHQRDWNTRTGAPSRWQDIWTAQDEAAWQHHGGPDLLRESGYSCVTSS